MIILRTGLPGASKTLTSISEICKSERITTCSLYYNNIKYFCLDLENIDSFGIFFFNFYLPSLSEFPQNLKTLVSSVHQSGRLVELSDFPVLSNQYNDWKDSQLPIQLFVKWVNIAYPNDKTKLFNAYFSQFPNLKKSDLFQFNLHWKYLSDPTEWFNCSHPSIILLDECQRHFPPRATGSRVPRHVSEFETHRHLGTDVYLVTQDAKLLDSSIRRLAGSHIHLVNLMGSKRVRRLESPETFDPSDYFQRKAAVTSLISHPTKLYGIYFSTLEHTHKLKIPKKVFYPIFFLLLLFLLAYNLWGSLNKNVTPPISPSPQTTPINAVTTSSSVKHISELVLPGCASVTFSGYSSPQSKLYLNCISDVETTVVHRSGSEDLESEFEETYKISHLIDSTYLKIYGYNLEFYDNLLFIVDKKNKINFFVYDLNS
jgi:zona occludens toxin